MKYSPLNLTSVDEILEDRIVFNDIQRKSRSEVEWKTFFQLFGERKKGKKVIKS
jgi:hypothetical protein